MRKHVRRHDLVPRVPRVELCKGGGWDPLQHLLGEDPQKLPANVQRLENSSRSKKIRLQSQLANSKNLFRRFFFNPREVMDFAGHFIFSET